MGQSDPKCSVVFFEELSLQIVKNIYTNILERTKLQRVSNFLYKVKECQSPSHVQLFVTPWTVALATPPSSHPTESSVHRIFQARILEWIAIPFWFISELCIPSIPSQAKITDLMVLALRLNSACHLWEIQQKTNCPNCIIQNVQDRIQTISYTRSSKYNPH